MTLYLIQTPAGFDVFIPAIGPADALAQARDLTGNGAQEDMGLPNLSRGDIQPCHVREATAEDCEL